MLYIEDLKSAFRAKYSIDQTEKCIEELKKSREKAINDRQRRRISAEIEMLELKVTILHENIHDVVEFIENCDDVIVSAAMYHRFLLGKKWDSVACAVDGYNSPDCIRKMVSRYLDKKGIVRKVK